MIQFCRQYSPCIPSRYFWVKGHSDIYGNQLVDGPRNSARLKGTTINVLMSATYIEQKRHKEANKICNNAGELMAPIKIYFIGLPQPTLSETFSHHLIA